ncbi:hypothetical protein [Lactiplantibacillus plantarum]|uniref:hypothetical protein n=1 Tax=Lactiplantibacillus plantarum TaxID=1590 RepID=UPI001BACCBE0|nr:hypothetical protein [Lactiplantibacillus plantarum]MBS0956646.1 hypothetical protein [Lactiplantibacillus plantarum]
MAFSKYHNVFVIWLKSDPGKITDWLSAIGTLAAVVLALFTNHLLSKKNREMEFSKSRPFFLVENIDSMLSENDLVVPVKNSGSLPEFSKKRLVIKNVSKKHMMAVQVKVTFGEKKDTKITVDYFVDVIKNNQNVNFLYPNGYGVPTKIVIFLHTEMRERELLPWHFDISTNRWIYDYKDKKLENQIHRPTTYFDDYDVNNFTPNIIYKVDTR